MGAVVHGADENQAAAREVTLTELRERTAAVVAAVTAGEAGVISRHGRPVAILLPLADGDTLAPASADEDGLVRLAERFERRRLAGEWSALMHGRWLNGGGIHGRYR